MIIIVYTLSETFQIISVTIQLLSSVTNMTDGDKNYKMECDKGMCR